MWHDGGVPRPIAEVARDTVALARPYARELAGSEDALEEVDRLLAVGGGAARQRAAFERGGMAAVLAGLADETAH